MKLPSLHTLLDKSFATLIRFPLVMLAATAGVYFAIRLNNVDYNDNELKELFTRCIMTASLALTLFLSVKIYGERKNFSVKIESLLHLLPVVLLVVYYLCLPPVINVYAITQFVLFNIGLHLLVSISPFLAGHEPNGFWQYNKALFLRILTAALYSAVLFIGLALALLAIDKLFEVNIDGKWYFRLWIVIAGIVNTWIFLAGVPHRFHELEAVTDYPKGLKIFTQYILLPIITVYMLILYGYEIKILATSHWPVGWVSYLVLAFSIVGILSLLLIWPIRENADSTWIKSYSRFFYMALLPLIAMLFIAIFKRVFAYGITENRYFIIVLAAWLTCISLYFVFSSRKNIRLIPLTLCLIAFLSSFGPWGAFSISERSQYKRLYSLLDKNKILKEGKVKPNVVTVSDSLSQGTGGAKHYYKIPFRDRKQISSVVEYMVNVHGIKSLQPLFTEVLKDKNENKNSWENRSDRDIKDDLLDKMGVKYVPGYQRDNEEEAEFKDSTLAAMGYNFTVPKTDYTDVSGYDIFLQCYIYRNTSDKDSIVKVYHLDDDTIKLSFNCKSQILRLFSSGNEMFSEDVKQMEENIKSANVGDDHRVDPKLMTVEGSSDKYKIKVVLYMLSFTEEKKVNELEKLGATIFLKRNNKGVQINHK